MCLHSQVDHKLVEESSDGLLLLGRQQALCTGRLTSLRGSLQLTSKTVLVMQSSRPSTAHGAASSAAAPRLPNRCSSRDISSAPCSAHEETGPSPDDRCVVCCKVVQEQLRKPMQQPHRQLNTLPVRQVPMTQAGRTSITECIVSVPWAAFKTAVNAAAAA